MRTARIGQVKHRIHFSRCQRNRGWCNPHITRCMVFAMGLNQTTCIARIGLQMQHTIGVRIQDGIAFNLLITGQANHTSIAGRHLVQAFAFERWHVGIRHKLKGLFCFQIRKAGFGILLICHSLCFILTSTAGAIAFGLLRNHQIRIDVCFDMPWRINGGRVNFKPAFRRLTAHKRSTSNIRNFLHRDFGGQTVRNFNHSTLGIAIQQQITFAIDHDGAANLV